MEFKNPGKIDEQIDFTNFEGFNKGDELTERRLNSLLIQNTEYERQSQIYSSEREKVEAELMKNPLSPERVFSYFGLLLGTFLTAVFFLEISPPHISAGQITVLLLINTIPALIGYLSGKIVGKWVSHLEKSPWRTMMAVMPFLGLLWGSLSVGTFMFLVGIAVCILGNLTFSDPAFITGVIYSAITGGTVGTVVLPVFAVFHRLLKRGDKMDRKNFLPIAFGITFVVSAFIGPFVRLF